MHHLDRMEQVAKHAEQDFSDREDYAPGRRYHHYELQAATRKTAELLRHVSGR